MRDGSTTLYLGAAGVIWALDYLERAGLAPALPDFAGLMPHLAQQNRREYASFGWYPRHASLLMGDVGVMLVTMRIAPNPATADALERRTLENLALPPLELMWGLPGTMLAALFMAQATHEARWRTLFERQAERLLSELKDTDHGPLWVQELYGSSQAYLGPVHGFAGQMLALARGWDWLNEAQRVRIARSIERTLQLNAREAAGLANWPALAGEKGTPYLTQYCHGAPGIVASFAAIKLSSSVLDDLLRRAGELVWRAGPLRKGGGLCHGTAGNGYALLKLYGRTGNTVWLERARAFAMSAIDQCHAAKRRYGKGRYTLWTGDLGLAVYLYDCLRGEAKFPTIDVL